MDRRTDAKLTAISPESFGQGIKIPSYENKMRKSKYVNLEKLRSLYILGQKKVPIHEVPCIAMATAEDMSD